MEAEVAEAYRSSLKDLAQNSKPLINMLTMLADDNEQHATVIIDVIEEHIQKVKPSLKLPVLYLVDSIIKNLQTSTYRTLFPPKLVKIFCEAFEKVDERTRQAMFKLRQTWANVIPNNKLYAIDVRVNATDPAWPITATAPEQGSIHVNPKFLVQEKKAAVSLSQPESAQALMQRQLLEKQQELQKLKLELELAETTAKLEQQRKQLELKKQHIGHVNIHQDVPISETRPKDPRMRDPRRSRDPRKAAPSSDVVSAILSASKVEPTLIPVQTAPPIVTPFIKDPPVSQANASASFSSNSLLGSHPSTLGSRLHVNGPLRTNQDNSQTCVKKETIRPTKKVSDTSIVNKSKSATNTSSISTKASPQKSISSQRVNNSTTKINRPEIPTKKKSFTKVKVEVKDTSKPERNRTEGKIFTTVQSESPSSVDNNRGSSSRDSEIGSSSRVRGSSRDKDRGNVRENDRSRGSDRRSGDHKDYDDRSLFSPRSSRHEDGKSHTSSRHGGSKRDSSDRSSRRSRSPVNKLSPRGEQDRNQNSAIASTSRTSEKQDKLSVPRKLDIDERKRMSPKIEAGAEPDGFPEVKKRRLDDTVESTSSRKQEDISDLFGSEDIDYRTASSTIPFKSPGQKGWAKFKENHPENYQHEMERRRSNEIESEQDIDFRRRPSHSPTARPQIPVEMPKIPDALTLENQEAILRVAEQQLLAGLMTHQQHQDVLRQLTILYDAQRSFKEKKSISVEEEENKHKPEPARKNVFEALMELPPTKGEPPSNAEPVQVTPEVVEVKVKESIKEPSKYQTDSSKPKSTDSVLTTLSPDKDKRIFSPVEREAELVDVESPAVKLEGENNSTTVRVPSPHSEKSTNPPCSDIAVESESTPVEDIKHEVSCDVSRNIPCDTEFDLRMNEGSWMSPQNTPEDAVKNMRSPSRLDTFTSPPHTFDQDLRSGKMPDLEPPPLPPSISFNRQASDRSRPPMQERVGRPKEPLLETPREPYITERMDLNTPDRMNRKRDPELDRLRKPLVNERMDVARKEQMVRPTDPLYEDWPDSPKDPLIKDAPDGMGRSSLILNHVDRQRDLYVQEIDRRRDSRERIDRPMDKHIQDQERPVDRHLHERERHMEPHIHDRIDRPRSPLLNDRMEIPRSPLLNDRNDRSVHSHNIHDRMDSDMRDMIDRQRGPLDNLDRPRGMLSRDIPSQDLRDHSRPRDSHFDRRLDIPFDERNVRAPEFPEHRRSEFSEHRDRFPRENDGKYPDKFGQRSPIREFEGNSPRQPGYNLHTEERHNQPNIRPLLSLDIGQPLMQNIERIEERIGRPELDDVRGPLIDRMGSDHDMDRRHPGVDIDRRGSEVDFDRRGLDQDIDRRGPSFDNRRGPVHEVDRRGPDAEFGRRGPGSDVDRRGPALGVDRRRSPELDRFGRRGMTDHAERQQNEVDNFDRRGGKNEPVRGRDRREGGRPVVDNNKDRFDRKGKRDKRDHRVDRKTDDRRKDGSSRESPVIDRSKFPPLDPRWGTCGFYSDRDKSEIILNNRAFELFKGDKARAISIGKYSHEYYADAKLKGILVDGRLVYNFGEPPKDVTLSSGDIVNVFYLGLRKEMWIDGVRHEVRIDAPPKKITLNNKTYGIQIDGNDMMILIDRLEKGMFGGEPRQIFVEGMLYDLRFEPQPRQILVDGQACDLDLSRKVPVLIINGEPRMVRFDGPPRIVRIDNNRYEVKVHYPAKIKIGVRSCFVALGGPGHELIINGKWHEIKFDNVPREITINDCIHKIALEGPVPQLKILEAMPPGFEDALLRQFRHSLPYCHALPPLDEPEPSQMGPGMPMQMGPGMPQPGQQMMGPGSQMMGPGQRMMGPGGPRDMFQPQQMIRQVSQQMMGPGPQLGMGPGMFVNQGRMGMGMNQMPLQGNVMQQMNPGFNQQQFTGGIPNQPMGPPASGVANVLSMLMPGTSNVQQNQQPNPAPLGGMDLGTLFSKLVAAGIVKSESNPSTETKKSTTTSKANKKPTPVYIPNALPVLEEPEEIKEPLAPIPDISDFNIPKLKRHYKGVIQRLYDGIQCSTCGIRFVMDDTERYREHLDWHFRQNKRGKDEFNMAKNRSWHYEVNDWILFELIEESEEKARSSVFENMLHPGDNALSFKIPEGCDYIQEPPASQENDNVCCICADPFEQFWHEELEDWHLRDALLVDGKYYHPVCFEDARDESIMEATPTPTESPETNPLFNRRLSGPASLYSNVINKAAEVPTNSITPPVIKPKSSETSAISSEQTTESVCTPTVVDIKTEPKSPEVSSENKMETKERKLETAEVQLETTEIKMETTEIKMETTEIKMETEEIQSQESEAIESAPKSLELPVATEVIPIEETVKETEIKVEQSDIKIDKL